MELNRKKKTLQANQAETQRVQKLRREYWTTIGEVSLKELVFIDETGVKKSDDPSLCESEKRFTREMENVLTTLGRNVTLIGAICVDAFLAPLTFEGWTFSGKPLRLMLHKFLSHNCGMVLVLLWTIYQHTKLQHLKKLFLQLELE